ncbi:hypothetical protein ACQ859_16340 [Roseateles chitinivorans]|uniref:hypothetical protein n=1 Tax=Roseateles chitinivorans TaxID=2917965 RepID=UPI003D674941
MLTTPSEIVAVPSRSSKRRIVDRARMVAINFLCFQADNAAEEVSWRREELGTDRSRVDLVIVGIYMSVKFVIGEYRLLWEALKRHQSELESEFAVTEDDQLVVDDKLFSSAYV